MPGLRTGLSDLLQRRERDVDLAVCKKGKCSGRGSRSEGTMEEQQELGCDGDL